jgi:hypothetical protein
MAQFWTINAQVGAGIFSMSRMTCLCSFSQNSAISRLDALGSSAAWQARG